MKTKKELKEEYKKMKSRMGVFQIRNIKNNKVLLDSSPDMLSKWNRHRVELRLKSHRNKSLQNDWNEYGEDSFTYEELSELKESEQETADYRIELKILCKMIIEEMNIDNMYK